MKKNTKNIHGRQSILKELIKRPHIAKCLTVLIIIIPCMFFMSESSIVKIIIGAFLVFKKNE